MSTETRLGDLDRKQIALIVVLVAITIVFATYGAGVIIAVANAAASAGITVTGEIDFNQIQAVIFLVVGGGLVLLGITTGASQVRGAIKDNDATWMAEPSASMTPFSPTDAKRGIGYEFEDLYKKTLLMTSYIQKIYASDTELTPAEQQDAIHILAGITAAEMEALIPVTGPKLAEEIRKLIHKYRATNRTDKDTHS